MSRHCKLLVVGVVGLILSGTDVSAQEFGRYREFALGSNVAAVSMVTGTAPADIKIIHQRPALIQELTWRPRYGVRRAPGADNESVEQVVFTFYDDQLYRVAVEYDRERTAGLSDGDMVEALALVYGQPVKAPVSARQPSSTSEELGTPLGQWGNAENTIRLYRVSSFAIRFRLVVTGEPTAALARSAAVRALALDVREAPQREAALAKKDAEDRRLATEKSRSENKPTFRP